MKLIIGLGNPGKEYERTRHNAGFLAIAEIRTHPSTRQRTGKSEINEWKFEKKFNAEVAEGKVGGKKVMLAKPQTYMNKSGEAVRVAIRFYKIKPGEVWVLHDDLDLPLGTLRIKSGGSAAGHQGVQSIIDAIGVDFVRFRIGTGARPSKIPAEKFVLGKFSPAETKKLKPVLLRVSEAVVTAIKEGLPKAMSLYSH